MATLARRAIGAAVGLSAVLAAAAPAHAIEPSLGVALEGNYGRAVSPVPVEELRDFGAFAVRARGVVGDPVGYGFGLDLSLGGATGGFAYDATAYPIAFAAAFAGGDFVGVFAGVGVDGVVGVLSPAARFPLELHVELQAGPLRLTMSAAPAWVVGVDERRKGTMLGPWVDEFMTSFTIGYAPVLPYWMDLVAGPDVYIGLWQRQMVGDRIVGASLGLGFYGGK